MKKISSNKIESLVKILNSVVFGTAFVFQSLAAGKIDTKAVVEEQAIKDALSSTAGAGNDATAKVLRQQLDDEKERDKNAKCDSAVDQIRAEREKISNACKEISAGHTQDCMDKIDTCSEASGSNSYNSLGSFAQVLGVPSDITSAFSAQMSAACPQWSGKDYYDKKKDIEREIKETEIEIAGLDNEKADIKKDYDDAVKEAQKELEEEEKAFDELKSQLKEEERTMISDAQEQQSKASEEMRKKGMEKLRLKGKLIQSQYEKASKLLQISPKAGHATCRKAAEDYKKSIGFYSTKGAVRLIDKGRTVNLEAKRIYSDCVSTINNQRAALNDSFRQEQEELNRQISNIEEEVRNIQDSLNTAQSLLQQIKDESKGKENKAMQDLVKKMEKTQKQMQDAYTVMMQKTQGLDKKAQSLQKSLNNLNQQLMQLGVPPEGSSTAAPKEVASSIDQALDNIEDIKRHYSEYDCRFDSKGSGGRGGSANTKKAGANQ